MTSIDINCDMGEGFGNYHLGSDEAIFPYITSSNIACGFHAGDPVQMEKTIALAISHDVQIGAHPGYPDLQGFGRRKMLMSPSELKSMIKYQLAAIMGVAESLGAKVKYVKPHGALYNTAAHDQTTALAIIEGVSEIDDQLYLMGLAGCPMADWARQSGLPFVAEAFADRRYESTGKLRSRALAGAVIQDAEEAANQVLNIVMHGKIVSFDGAELQISAQSICIHGDNPKALAILKEIDRKLKQNNIVKRSFSGD